MRRIERFASTRPEAPAESGGTGAPPRAVSKRLQQLQRATLVALNAVPDVGRATLCQLALTLDRWLDVPLDELPGCSARLSVGREPLRRVAAQLAHRHRAAEREECRARAIGGRILVLGEPGYPAPLLDLSLPPPVLYCRGELPRSVALAMVGSRKADAYGLEVAELFARELAAKDATIVSGMAIGIDTAAHRGALAAEGGRTVAVLGCGLDVGYPRSNRKLATRIAERGAVISEFPMGSSPWARNFPIRNRVIAALTAGTLVVRATPRSGSLITARLALELGRDVYAVPGNIFDPRAHGPNTLIRDGALPAQHPREILESLPSWMQERLLPFERGEAAEALPTDRTQRALFQALPKGELMAVEAVAEHAAKPIDQVLAGLLELELAGWVRRYPGPSFCRKT